MNDEESGPSDDTVSSDDSVLSELDESIKIKAGNKGKRKESLECLSARNVQKVKKNKGKEYKTHSGKGNVVNKKLFKPVDQCCTMFCHIRISEPEQFKIFNTFWDSGDKNIQDNMIVNSLVGLPPKRIIATDQRKNKVKLTSWKYKVKFSGLEVECCRNFLFKFFKFFRN